MLIDSPIVLLCRLSFRFSASTLTCETPPPAETYIPLVSPHGFPPTMAFFLLAIFLSSNDDLHLRVVAVGRQK